MSKLIQASNTNPYPPKGTYGTPGDWKELAGTLVVQPLSLIRRLTSVTVVVTKTMTSVVVSITTGTSAWEVLIVVDGDVGREDEVEETVDGGGAGLVEDAIAEDVVLGLVDDESVVAALVVDGGASVPDGVVDWPSLPLSVTDVVLAAGITDDNALDAGGGVPGSVVKTASLFTAQKLST